MANLFDSDFSPEAAERQRQQPPAQAPQAQPSGNVFDTDFAPPAAPPSIPPVGPQISTAQDIQNTLPGAAARGVIGAPGFAGNLQSMVRSGMDWLLPPSEKQLAARAEADKFNLLPTSQTLIKAAEPVTGKMYEPQTPGGKIVGAGVEALPSAAFGSGATGVIPRVASAFGSGAGGEAAGLATEGTVLEKPARVLGSVLGGVAAPKSITPYTNMNNAERAAQVQLLESSGVPLRAGERLGNPALQRLEEKAAIRTGGIGAGERINERQATEFDRAVTDRAVPRSGSNQVIGNAPTPRVLQDARTTASNEYDRIFRGQEFQYDNAFGQAMDRAVAKAGGSLPKYNKANIDKLSTIREDITDAVVANQGKFSAKQFKEFHSDLGEVKRQAYREGNETLGNAAKEMQLALSNRMSQSLGPDRTAALKLNDIRYANLKSLESASARSGGEHITPQNLVAAQKVGRPAQFAAGSLPLDQLADAGRSVMRPLPTAKDTAGASLMRSLRSVIPGSGAGGLGYLAAGPVGAAVAGGVGAGASALKNRAVLSGPGQAYLGNQVGPIAAREAIARAMLEQAMRGQ